MLPKEEVEIQLQLPSWKAKFTDQIGSLSLLQQSFGVCAGNSQHANLQMHSDPTGQWYMPLKTQNLPRADSIPDTDFIRRDSKSQWNIQTGNTPLWRLPVVLSVMCYRSHGESRILTSTLWEKWTATPQELHYSSTTSRLVILKPTSLICFFTLL